MDGKAMNEHYSKEKFTVFHSHTGKVHFVADICVTQDMHNAKKLGRAALWGIKNGYSLQDADLAGAELSGVDLSGADLTMACLQGANLSNANLKGAKLTKTVLRQANLKGAKLSRTSLFNACVAEAQLPVLEQFKLYVLNLFSKNAQMLKPCA